MSRTCSKPEPNSHLIRLTHHILNLGTDTCSSLLLEAAYDMLSSTHCTFVFLLRQCFPHMGSLGGCGDTLERATYSNREADQCP